MSRAEIESHGFAALMEGLLQQHALNRLQDIADCIYWLLQSNILARTLEGTTGNYLDSVVNYVAQTGNVGDKAETRKLLNDIAAILPAEKGERVMTIAETLKNEGMQQGIQAGMQQGVRTVAQNMLRHGLSEADIAECTGLSLQEVAALRKQMTH